MVEPDRLPQTIAEGIESFVHHFGVCEDEPRAGLRREAFLDASKLPWQPHVVLIREHDEVAFAELDGLLEVFRRAEVPLVDVEVHGEGRGGGELFDDCGRSVRGAVVADP
jgi:hypothetical protein